MPNIHVASCPERAVVARFEIFLTKAIIPPFLDMMPTMPPIIKVKRITLMWSLFTREYRIAFGTSRKASPKDFDDFMPIKTKPEKIPMVKLSKTSFNKSAKPIATIGGMMLVQSGMFDNSDMVAN